jgi:hypothetical protein
VSQKSLPSPHLPPSLPIQEVEEEEEEERLDYLDIFDAYDWTLEEELYDDQLFRIPVSPTALESDNLPLEVFVDNVYCGELERSPSPITYARPASSDFSDEELHGGRRRRARRRTHVEQEERTTPKRVDYNISGVSASPTGNRRHSRRSDPSSPISYHSDDLSLYLTGNRPVSSRRRRREQLRSYKYSFRPPVTPTAAAAATAVSLNTLAGFPRKVIRRDMGLHVTLGCQRSPSPIEYARRRSLDGLYGLDSEDEVDEDESEVVFAHPPPVGGEGVGLVSRWGESSGLEFDDDDARRKSVSSGGGKGRMVQPRSFMHAYSKPLAVASCSGERQRVLEKERGRRKERTLVPMPLGGYVHTGNSNIHGNNNSDNNNSKERTRKGSRGFLDELAAVAVPNTHHSQQSSKRKTHNYNVSSGIAGTPRTSGGSPPPPPMLPSLPPLPFHSRDEKEKEKEKKRRWVWELSKSDGSGSRDKLVVGSGNGSSSTLEGESGEGVLVLDIGNANANANGGGGGGGGCGEGYEGWNAVWPGEDDERCGGGWRGRSKRHSLNGLEFV